jgi:uncharacterized protein (DUF1800 family)
MFGAKTSQVNQVLAMTPSEAVELLFQTEAPPEVPGSWVTEAPDFNSPYNSQRMSQLRTWWVRLMYEQPISIREKLTLFWHNHFVSESATVVIPQYVYKQNTLFRNYAAGNFKELTKQVTRDPAMLIYLDGRYNIVGNPNENYARELLELFTMGIGNYSETDVREAARALTGWILSGLGSVLVPGMITALSSSWDRQETLTTMTLRILSSVNLSPQNSSVLSYIKLLYMKRQICHMRSR